GAVRAARAEVQGSDPVGVAVLVEQLLGPRLGGGRGRLPGGRLGGWGLRLVVGIDLVPCHLLDYEGVAAVAAADLLARQIVAPLEFFLTFGASNNRGDCHARGSSSSAAAAPGRARGRGRRPPPRARAGRGGEPLTGIVHANGPGPLYRIDGAP